MHKSPTVFADAAQRLQTGDFSGAALSLRSLLQDEPTSLEGWLRLAEVCRTLGRSAEAAGACREVLRLRPDHGGAHNTLGVLLLDQGRLAEARTAFEEALACWPHLADAHSNRGIVLMGLGEVTAAEQSFQQAVQVRPDYAEGWHNWALARARQGKHLEALPPFREALRLKPDYAQAHVNLGHSLRALNRTEEAGAAYDQALQLRPEDSALQNDRGGLLLGQRHFASAVEHFRAAVRLRPDFVEAHNNLGFALVQQRQPAAALACFAEALRLRPEAANTHFNRGVALEALGRADEALACYRQALRLRPDYPEALNNLGNAFKDQGRIDESVACYRRGLQLRPDEPSLWSNLLFALQYHPSLSPEALWEEHRHFGLRVQAPALAAMPATPVAAARRKLRVGYLSPDFRNHVVGSFVELVLRAHDRERFEVVCLADIPKPDAGTERARALSDRWVELTGLPHAAAAARVADEVLDILVDLAGHTGGNRLPVLARRPAPIQATLYGYPGTTGLTTVDYRLTDSFQDPEGLTEAVHSERLLRLPDALWCYRGGPDLPPGPPPVTRTDCITFGALNNPAKVSAERLARWAEVLRAVPRSRLIVLNGGTASARDWLLDTLAINGIEARRVKVLGRRVRDDYFRPYGEVDICLDTFPYTGCNTTADALWMGVPVVTQAGRWSVTRQGVAPLMLTGLGELVTDSPEAYVAAAIRLAGDLAKLTVWRRELRDRLRQSPLMDSQQYTRGLEAAYQAMWDKWTAAHS